MTHRERILTALDHRVPDRLPIDMGTTRFTGIVRPAYENLRSHLGFGTPGPVVDRMMQVVDPDEAILRHLDVDARAVSQSAPDRGGDQELDDGRYRDEWGVVRRRPPGCHYYELFHSPLSGKITAGTIAHYPFPDPTDPGRIRGVRERARQLREQSDFAVIYNARYNLVHQTQYLRGFEDWFCDLVEAPDRFHALMEAVTENLLELNRRLLPEVAEYVDVVAFGDDVGLQDRAVCSPPMYRRMIRPYQERFTEQIRALTKARIMYHSCGSVYSLIEDFIGIGVDALNPVQVTARNMEPERLKREFGERISFWGGMDSHRLLPTGTPDQVRAGARRMFETLGAGGGYVLAAVHNIQPDVSPGNILAMFEEARKCVY